MLDWEKSLIFERNTMIQRIKGTQDLLDLTLFNFLIDQFKKQAQRYHFTEIATPILEPLELFKRSLGVHTDVVSKEMFLIDTHHEDEERICLRPEATASTTRAFMENHIQMVPWKVFSYGPMFRYERPQKGRYRQFHQINLEIIGTNAIAQDVQVIKMLDRFFHEYLHLNNYALQINFLGCVEDRIQYKAKLLAFLNTDVAASICDTCKIRKETNILRIFDCKNQTCQEIYRKAPAIVDHLCAVCAHEWHQLLEQLSLLSVTYIQAPHLVRGLDYYNKTVFEFTSMNLGAQNAFCGGGRYELTSQFGAQPCPSIGAAIGIERVILLLEAMRETIALPQLPTLYVVMPLSAEQVPLALLIADELYAADLCAEVMVEHDSVKSMMRHANKMGAHSAIIIGADEQQNRTVMVKNMTTGAQESVAQNDLVQYLKK